MWLYVLKWQTYEIQRYARCNSGVAKEYQVAGWTRTFHHHLWMASNQGLLETILGRLSKLPGKRDFTASVLVSQPRKSPELLFPYAPNIHESEIYIQDVLILVSEYISLNPNSVPLPLAIEGEPATRKASPAPPPFITTSPAFVSGLEAVVYVFPVTHSVIVYISKVDSTGQGKRPSPTKALMFAFFEYVTTHWFGHYTQTLGEGDSQVGSAMGWDIWIQLFARAQNQYLFPASIEYEGKRVLSDIGLVRWWKSMLDEYISEVVGSSPNQRKQASKYIIIPGLSPEETSYTLKPPARNAAAAKDWIVGHPYSTPGTVFPLGTRPPSSISQLIPFFPDDPKARLIVEIANTTTKGPATTTTTDTPPRKKRKLEDGRGKSADEDEGLEDEGKGMGVADVDYLRTVPAEEFWERMDGRQECRLGTVAFFTVHIGSTLSPPPPGEPNGGEPPLPLPLSPRPRAEVPLGTVRKIAAWLDNADFGTLEKACRSTERLQDQIRALVADNTVVTSRIPGLAVGEDFPVEENDQALLSHVMRTIEVSNPELVHKPNPPPVEVAPVTVLTARKKKKPPAA